jgi:hypothetical protein
MGSGIAQVVAAAGHAVRLFDNRAGAAATAVNSNRSAFDRLAGKGRMGAESAARAAERLAVMAQRVEMTKMPALVAFCHSMIELAAVFIAVAAAAEPWAFAITSKGGPIPGGNRIELALGAFIGAITFIGSVIAFGKLGGKYKSRLFQGAPVQFAGQHHLNLALGLGAAFFVFGFWQRQDRPYPIAKPLMCPAVVAALVPVHRNVDAFHRDRNVDDLERKVARERQCRLAGQSRDHVGLRDQMAGQQEVRTRDDDASRQSVSLHRRVDHAGKVRQAARRHTDVGQRSEVLGAERSRYRRVALTGDADVVVGEQRAPAKRWWGVGVLGDCQIDVAGFERNLDGPQVHRHEVDVTARRRCLQLPHQRRHEQQLRVVGRGHSEANARGCRFERHGWVCQFPQWA